MKIDMGYLTLSTRSLTNGDVQVGYKVNLQKWMLDESGIAVEVGILNEEEGFYLVVGEPWKMWIVKKERCFDTETEAYLSK